MEQLYVGVGREEITPPLGTMLRGYTPVRACTSVHDRLHVTVFMFGWKDTRAMMVSADLCTLHDESYAATVKVLSQVAELPKEQIILATTHTHSGPHLNLGEQSREVLENVFLPAVEKAARTAVQTMQPALMGIGTTTSDVAINRRQITASGRVTLGQNPYGTYDPTMTVIAFRQPDGTPIANMIHYGCHNTGSGKNQEVTRDWCGVAIDRLEAQTGAITAFFNGCGGDCGPRLSNGKTTGDLQMALELGGRAATDAIRAYNSIRVWESGQLKTHFGQITMPLKDLGTEEQLLEQIRQQGDPAKMTNNQRNLVARNQERIQCLRRGETLPTSQLIPHGLISIGPLVFMPMPFEPFSITTLRVKEHSVFPYTVCVGYANDNLSYFPSMDQLIRGGYEVLSFQADRLVPFVDDAEQYYVAGCLELIRKLHDQE